MLNKLPSISTYIEELDNKILKYSHKNSSPKKVAARVLFWNFKYLFRHIHKKNSFTDDKMHIAIEFTGGVGDFVSSVKYVEGLSKYLGDKAIFDLICEARFLDILKILVHEKTYIHDVFVERKRNYDLEIKVVRFPQIVNYFSHRLDKKAQDYVANILNFQNQNPLLFQNDFLATCYSLNMDRTRENQADIDNLLSLKNMDFSINLQDEISQILKKFGLKDKRFISLQVGAGSCFSKYQTDTRQWNVSNYEKLVELLRAKYPDYKIVQLGESRQLCIRNVDTDLRGKTSFSELLVLLKAAKLHISQEGGMAILRHFVHGGKSVVLFGPTDERFYGFDGNLNLSCRSCPYPCEWLNKHWITTCIKTGNIAECMQNLHSKKVFDEITAIGDIL